MLPTVGLKQCATIMCVCLHAWLCLFVGVLNILVPKTFFSRGTKGVGFLLYSKALVPNLFIVRVLAATLISFSLEVYGIYS